MNESTVDETVEVEETENTETAEDTVEQDQVTDEQADSDAGYDEGSEEGDDEGEADEYEFDFGGNALRVPKKGITPELAEEVQKFGKGLWSDYTRKSQHIAESAKSLQVREQNVQKLQQLQGDALDTYSRGLGLRQELDQLSKVDINSLWQSDPDQARKVSDAISQKTAEFNDVVSRVSQYEQAISHTQAAETARRAEEGKRFIEQRVKGFTKQAGEVIDYVTSNYGIPKSEAETWPLNPAAAEMAYKAMMYDKLQAKTKKKTSPRVEKVEVKPNKPFRSNSGKANKNPDKMSADEWLKWRNSQLAKKR